MCQKIRHRILTTDKKKDKARNSSVIANCIFKSLALKILIKWTVSPCPGESFTKTSREHSPSSDCLNTVFGYRFHGQCDQKEGEITDGKPL